MQKGSTKGGPQLLLLCGLRGGGRGGYLYFVFFRVCFSLDGYDGYRVRCLNAVLLQCPKAPPRAECQRWTLARYLCVFTEERGARRFVLVSVWRGTNKMIEGGSRCAGGGRREAQKCGLCLFFHPPVESRARHALSPMIRWRQQQSLSLSLSVSAFSPASPCLPSPRFLNEVPLAFFVVPDLVVVIVTVFFFF